MFLTYNRTSWIALMVGLFLLQLFYPQFRKVYFTMVIVAAIVLAVTWEQVNESAVVNERINSDHSTLDSREARWQAGYNMWKVKPLRGWGFDAFGEQSGRFRSDGGRANWGSPENDFIYIMVGSGLIGLLPYLVFLIAPLIDSLRLFFVRMRAPDWSGFIKAETIAIYWVTIICFVIGSYTQIQNIAIVKMIPFALAGAIIGTHHHWLRRPIDHSVSKTHQAAGTVLEKNEPTAV
jgi:O-antigen ligase